MILLFISLVFAQEYLSITELQSRLTQEIPSLADCLKKEQSGSILIKFSISKDGKLSLNEEKDCFKGLESIQFPSHPQGSNEYQWNLVIQDQKIFPIQLTEVKEEQLFPGIFSLKKETLFQRLNPKKQEIESGDGQ